MGPFKTVTTKHTKDTKKANRKEKKKAASLISVF
jgi:hypothetical protein